MPATETMDILGQIANGKYLRGRRGTVSSKAAKRSGDIMVDFDHPIGRYGSSIGIPASCLRLED